MAKTFGETLRHLRDDVGVGLNKLANIIHISKGYLSDVENNKVPPPSVDIIEAIATVLNIDIWVLLRAADKEIEFITRKPEAADFLRKTKGFKPDDWRKAGQLVEIAGLGKEGKEEK